MKKIISLALLAILTYSGTTLGQTVQRITLQDAIQIALENNYLLKQAENNLELAEENIKSEYADFLPNITGNLSGSRTTGQQFIADRFSEGLDPFVNVTSQSISGNIRAGITIFDGFNNINTLRASSETQISREESLLRAKENVIFNAAIRFLQVLLDKELLDIARENLETSRTQLEQVVAQVEVGSRPAVDQYNQEAQVATDELTLTQRENSLSLNRLLLIRQLQIDPLGNYEFIVPEIDENRTFNSVGNYVLKDLIDEALLGRSDIRSEEASINALKYQLKIAQGGLFPTLTASASISSRYSDQYSLGGEKVTFSDQFFDQQVNRGIGINMSIPLFQNWNRMYSIQSSKVQLKNAQLSLDNSKLQVVQEVTQAFNDYSSYTKQREASQKSLIASEKAFETQQERYNVGASTLIELSQAQSTYVEAQSNYTQAIYNLIFQEKLLDFYLGKLSGEDVEF
ncbi:MAG: TolC family protein [Balneolaceae bacterium]|nr:TolC family protein [Balneolaceae bacterium]MBO6546580.1 TolC family protein [Balneolaceae bacterium]MBO6648939.1 TolC family protein [Balneolaceae bacterium]